MSKALSNALLFAILLGTVASPTFADLAEDDVHYEVTWDPDQWMLVQDPDVAQHIGYVYESAIGGGDGAGVMSGNGVYITNSAWVTDDRCFSSAALSMSVFGYTNGSWITVDGTDRVVKGHWHGHAEGSLFWSGGEASGDYLLMQTTSLPSTWLAPARLSAADQGGTEAQPARSLSVSVGDGGAPSVQLPPVDEGSEGEREALPYDSGPIPIKDCDVQFDMQLNTAGTTTIEADGGCWSRPAFMSSRGWVGIQLEIELLGDCPDGWPRSGLETD